MWVLAKLFFIDAGPVKRTIIRLLQVYIFKLKRAGVLHAARPNPLYERHFQCLLSFSASSMNLRTLEKAWVNTGRTCLTWHPQFLFLTEGLVRLDHKSIGRETHFELPLMEMVFACCIVCGASDLLPPLDMRILPPMAVKRVPRARCSFLIARPRITLNL